MKRITIDSEAYKSLVTKIDRIYDYIMDQSKKQAVPADPSTVWIDNKEAAELLEVSRRTLQRLRSGGEITYSIRGGKVRYRLSEVQRLLAGRVFPGKCHKKEKTEKEEKIRTKK